MQAQNSIQSPHSVTTVSVSNTLDTAHSAQERSRGTMWTAHSARERSQGTIWSLIGTCVSHTGPSLDTDSSKLVSLIVTLCQTSTPTQPNQLNSVQCNATTPPRYQDIKHLAKTHTHGTPGHITRAHHHGTPPPRHTTTAHHHHWSCGYEHALPKHITSEYTSTAHTPWHTTLEQ